MSQEIDTIAACPLGLARDIGARLTNRITRAIEQSDNPGDTLAFVVERMAAIQDAARLAHSRAIQDNPERGSGPGAQGAQGGQGAPGAIAAPLSPLPSGSSGKAELLRSYLAGEISGRAPSRRAAILAALLLFPMSKPRQLADVVVPLLPASNKSRVELVESYRGSSRSALGKLLSESRDKSTPYVRRHAGRYWIACPFLATDIAGRMGCSIPMRTAGPDGPADAPTSAAPV